MVIHGDKSQNVFIIKNYDNYWERRGIMLCISLKAEDATCSWLQILQLEA